MSVNLSGMIPFTELWERLLSMARIDTPNNEDFAKGVINDTYLYAIPRMQDWRDITEEAFLQMVAEYTTGTVSVSAGLTGIVGVGTLWTSAMTADAGYKIKFAGNDNIYKFTRTASTTGTISPALSGSTDLSGVAYKIYKDEYALASNFDRFLKNGSLYVYRGGRLTDTIKELPTDKFRIEAISDPSDPIKRCYIGRTNTAGYKMLRVNPPPKTAMLYPYEYIKQLVSMYDYVEGTVELANGSSTVIGTDTHWLNNVQAGDYLRLDANGTGNSSKWYKIEDVVSNTELNLEEAWEEDDEVNGEYTVSSAPTSLSSAFHEFILYESILVVVGEQESKSIEGFGLRRGEILADLKKNYKSRRTNVQFGVDDDGYR